MLHIHSRSRLACGRVARRSNDQLLGDPANPEEETTEDPQTLFPKSEAWAVVTCCSNPKDHLGQALYKPPFGN